MGSSPASPVRGPGDGSMTSGVPNQFKTCGQAAGILVGGFPACRNDLSAHPVSTCRNLRDSVAHGRYSRGHIPLGPSSLGVPPMSEVTRILSAIEQGDSHAAEQLLPLVYDELRKLAAERMAQEQPGHTLQAT